MKKDKFYYREAFEKWILENTPYQYMAYVLSQVDLLNPEGEPEFALDSLASGVGGWGNDAGGMMFPNELAGEYGGEEAQYGFIEFEVEALEGIDRVPFDDAYDIFAAGVEIFLEKHPDRRIAVEAKMREIRKTFDRLIARHEAWKKANRKA